MSGMKNTVSKMANFNPCCCLSLRTGSTVLAIVDMSFRVFFAGAMFYSLKSLAQAHSIEDPNYKQQVTQHLRDAFPEMKDSETHTIYLVLYALYGTQLALLILHAVFDGLVIIGVRQERPNLLKIWLILKASTLVFTFAVLITLTLKGNQKEPVKRRGVGIVGFIFILFELYFFYVVFALHKEMRNNLKNYQRPKPRN